MSWGKVDIGNLVTLRQGFAINKKTKHFLSDVPTDLPLLRIADMKNGTENVFVNDTIPKKFIAKSDDIIYTRTGQVGLVFTNQFGVIHNNCFTVTPRDETILCRRYLYYALQDKAFFDEANSKATGAAQPDLPHDAFNTISIYLPPIDAQHRITDMLSAYDDLIENNQKQIKLLEEAAQRLYKEWFVDLRFPDHEHTKITDGVPEGWDRKIVAECLSFHGNGGWGKETPMGKNEHPGKVIRGTDIEDVKAGRFDGIPLRYHTDNDIKKRTLKKHDLVFELSNGNINNIGRCLFIDDLVLKNCGGNTICASFCKLLRPISKLHSLVLYWEIQDMQSSGRMIPLKKHGANGINNFDFDGFLNHKLLIPANTSMLEPIEAIMAKISAIQGQFVLLTEARNRLLPKLMSGEVEV